MSLHGSCAQFVLALERVLQNALLRLWAAKLICAVGSDATSLDVG